MSEPSRGAACVRRAAEITDELRKNAAAIRDAAHPAINGAGVLMEPMAYLRALRAAKDQIEHAIALHKSIRWPTPEDYDQT
jgi:hypothetical protein